MNKCLLFLPTPATNFEVVLLFCNNFLCQWVKIGYSGFGFGVKYTGPDGQTALK